MVICLLWVEHKGALAPAELDWLSWGPPLLVPSVVAYEVIAVLLTAADDTWGVLAHNAGDMPQTVGSAMPAQAGEDK